MPPGPSGRYFGFDGAHDDGSDHSTNSWGGEVARTVKDIGPGGMLWVFKLPKS